MNQIHHMNFGWLHAPPFPPASCHGLVVQTDLSLILVDTGIGMHDIANPEERIGIEAIQAAGFQFLPQFTAIRQLESLGFSADDVTDIVLTHCDPDHVGGLADFPKARVHVSAEEKQNFLAGNPRYNIAQFSHGPRWIEHAVDDSETLGLPSRSVITTSDLEIRLVPLFGHTLGHCGVAVIREDEVLLHVGDAYYLRDELVYPEHPVGQLATLRADDNRQRLASLNTLRGLASAGHPNLSYFGYHDGTELPPNIERYTVD
jgi:glyoxylase-like metal-dependent hydrolase (beta-lactamase superfamily II)